MPFDDSSRYLRRIVYSPFYSFNFREYVKATVLRSQVDNFQLLYSISPYPNQLLFGVSRRVLFSD